MFPKSPRRKRGAGQGGGGNGKRGPKATLCGNKMTRTLCVALGAETGDGGRGTAEDAHLSPPTIHHSLPQKMRSEMRGTHCYCTALHSHLHCML